jgi:chromosome segregation ATPase
LLVAALFVAGCSATPERPVKQLARAEGGIEHAEQSGAQGYAPEPLDRARKKLTDARSAVDKGNYSVAERLAHEAELDAEFAAARTDRSKADESLSEIRNSIETLRDEMTRRD